MSTTPQDSTSGSSPGAQARPLRRQLITNHGLHEMVALAGCQQANIAPEVVDALLMLAEEFTDDIASLSIALASHRGSSVVDVRDVQLALEKKYGMRIPGFVTGSRHGSSSIQMDPHATSRVREALPSEVHMRRLANTTSDSTTLATTTNTQSQ